MMDGKLEGFFSFPIMKRRQIVPINTKVELPVHKAKTWGFYAHGFKHLLENTGCVEVIITLICHFLDMCVL